MPSAFNLYPLSFFLYFPNDSGRIAGYYGVVRDILDDDAAGAYDCAGADGDAAEDSGVGADGSALFDHRRDYRPVFFGLKPAGFAGGPGVAVVDEHHTVADKNPVFDGHALADKGVAGYFAVLADEGLFLDFHKRTNPGAVIDPAAIEVDKVV